MSFKVRMEYKIIIILKIIYYGNINTKIIEVI